MDENAFYDPSNFTYPAGTQICEVEIDPDTGVVEIVNFTAVDDFGNIINPMIVEGQVHGGIAQGIGQALLENAVYDKETGQLLTGSYMDYTMPRADDVPSFKLGYQGHALPAQSAGREGLRRGRRDRRTRRRDECRPSTRWRRSASAHVTMPATPPTCGRRSTAQRRGSRVRGGSDDVRFRTIIARSRWPTPSAC